MLKQGQVCACILWPCFQKNIVCLIQSPRQVSRHIIGLHGQPGSQKESCLPGLPLSTGNKEVVDAAAALLREIEAPFVRIVTNDHLAYADELREAGFRVANSTLDVLMIKPIQEAMTLDQLYQLLALIAEGPLHELDKVGSVAHDQVRSDSDIAFGNRFHCHLFYLLVFSFSGSGECFLDETIVAECWQGEEGMFYQ
jgi:hypothetical protein